MHRSATSAREPTQDSRHVLRLPPGDAELLVPSGQFSWFRNVTIEQLSGVVRRSPDHLYWRQFEVDLSVECRTPTRLTNSNAHGLWSKPWNHFPWSAMD